MQNFLASIGVGAGHDTGGVEFWHGAERAGWLMKQGEIIKTWRRRWFVLKEGKMFWFLDQNVTAASQTRGVIDLSKCLSVKGAEDVINRAHSFELSSREDTQYFIADSARRGGVDQRARPRGGSQQQIPRRGRLRRVLATGRPSVRGEDRCKNTPNDVRTTPRASLVLPDCVHA